MVINPIQVIAGLYGLALGSFINVLNLRYGTKQSVVWARSACPHCHHVLQWWELVPVISYVVLRGKCAHCHRRVAIQYLLVELVMGAMIVALFTPVPVSSLGWLIALLRLGVVASLSLLALIDLRTFLLPDRYVGLLGLFCLALLLVAPPLHLLSHIGWGIAIGAGFLFSLWLLTRGRGIGLGDVKLLVVLGAYLGPLVVTVVLFLAFMAGGLVGIILLLRGKASLKTAVPFGPFLVGAALVVIFWPALPQYLSRWLLVY